MSKITCNVYDAFIVQCAQWGGSGTSLEAVIRRLFSFLIFKWILHVRAQNSPSEWHIYIYIYSVDCGRARWLSLHRGVHNGDEAAERGGNTRTHVKICAAARKCSKRLWWCWAWARQVPVRTNAGGSYARHMSSSTKHFHNLIIFGETPRRNVKLMRPTIEHYDLMCRLVGVCIWWTNVFAQLWYDLWFFSHTAVYRIKIITINQSINPISHSIDKLRIKQSGFSKIKSFKWCEIESRIECLKLSFIIIIII